MSARSRLTLALAGLFAALVALAAWVFLRSLAPSGRATNDAEFVVHLEPIIEGKLHVVRVKESPLFVLRPSAAQRAGIAAMDPYVFDKTHSYYSPELKAYVYWGVSTKWGCPLSEKTAEERRALWPDAPNLWLGGYWDSRCEVSYDYAGRTVSDPTRSFNGYAVRWPNLRSPRVQVSGLVSTISPQ